MGCERTGHRSRCLRRGGPGVRDLGHSSTSGLSDLFLEFGLFLWGAFVSGKSTPTIHRGSVEALAPRALTAEVYHRERAHARTAKTGHRAGVENPRP